MSSEVTVHQVVRYDIQLETDYDHFCRRFEAVVPMFDRDRAIELVERNALWSEVIADVAVSAPHDFLLYWKLDLAPLMNLAGHKRRATEYLIGNHVIAEMMYRHDPAVSLYVPLRCAIYESDAAVRFTIEQPSTNLSSLGCTEIREVGLDLDGKVTTLLAALTATGAAL